MSIPKVPFTTRVGHLLCIAIGLLSIASFAMGNQAAFKWVIGGMFAVLFGLHVFELARAKSIGSLYPDRRSRLPMLAIEGLALCGGIAALMSA